MPETNNLTDTTLPDGAQLTPADGGSAVAETLTLAEMNQTLGKDFKDKATALQALKDTFSYVGKKIETAAPSVQANPALEAKVQSLEEEIFYANNPEYKEHRELIKQFGKSPAEVVGTETFKALFEKVKVADRIAGTKSVVTSNARIAQATSHMDTAVTAANAGRKDQMLESLAKAVMESAQ